MEDRRIDVRNLLFYGGDGLRLSGELYVPECPAGDTSGMPAILLCQGLSGEKGKVLPWIANAFASSGYVTLAFDYGGCGQSGDRRGRPYVFPQERVEDALSAFAFMSRLSCVDPDSIGVYGISYGGAVAVYTAAYERRVKCLVVVSGPANGDDFLASLMEKSDWERLLKEIEDDRARRARGGKSKLMPLKEIIRFPASFWARYALLDSGKESESLPTETCPGQGPLLSLESAEAMMRLLPETVIPRVAGRPMLFVHGEKDDVARVALARRLYEKGGLPGDFVVLPGMDHIDLDTGEGLKKQVALSVRWFDRYLKPGGARNGGR